MATKLENISDENLIKWNSNKLVNPVTKRKIKETGAVYKNLKRVFFSRFRVQMIDPILMIELPVIENKPIFEFKYAWDPYTGERTGIAKKSLYFDPDTLIHTFYCKRLNHLWISSEDGTYGDAVGNGPDFKINSRGCFPEWYIFRIPDVDTYIPKDHNLQIPTMTPKLSGEEIKELYFMALTYGNNYEKTYKIKRPNIVLMKELYEEAISPAPTIPLKVFETEDDYELKNELQLMANRQAVEDLKYF